MKILQFPLIKIFIGVLFGIILFQIAKPNLMVIAIGFPVCLFVLLLAHRYSPKNRFCSIVFGCSVYLASFLVGIATAIIHKETLNQNHYTNQITDYDQQHQLKLLLHEKLKSSTKNYRYVCVVKELDHQKSTGKVILNIPKAVHQNYEIGTQLSIIGNIYKNKPPLNPNLFNYGKYLENQEIYAQVFTKKKQIEMESHVPGVWADFANFRDKIISNLERSDISKEELYVLNALILGQQQEISAEVLKDYQYAGAIHVLSVSGLHVGFILLFITYLLKPIPNSKKGALFKLLLVVISLWSFAILSGLSPSIVRSVTMFSFVAIGLYLKRTVNIYHTLLVSMLLILLFKPSFLFDVGFQLSYLALFFILWLQPILAQIWQPKNKIIRYFWDIITVSFAAQLGAMPLSIYYFHQFPGLFFVTNLLILPLLGIIMAAGVLAVVIAIFGAVPFYIAKPLECLIALLNSIIHWVASLDDFVIRNISFSKEMLWVSYMVIILVVLWLKKPEFKRLAFVFTGIVLLQGIFIFQKETTLNKAELIVFNCKKNTIISERSGADVTVYANDSLLENLENNILVQSYLVGNFCQAKEKKPVPNVINFKQQNILLIDSMCICPERIHPDILIITQSPKLNLARLLKTIRPKQIIADGSNFKSYINCWEATCRKEKIPFHNTNEKGFYKL